jgi:hypothetical protein
MTTCTLLLCALLFAVDVGETRATPCIDCTSRTALEKPARLWLDAKWNGVSLSDLPADVGLDGARLEARLRADNPAELSEILSVSVVTQHGDELLVMFVGRAKRFPSPISKKKDGLGVVVVAFTPNARNFDYRITETHALLDLSPRLRVSLIDRIAVLDFPGLGLRRAFPAGVGALDHVRAHPTLMSLTPLTERARLARDGSYESLGSWNRGMPYLTIQIPWVSTGRFPLYSERLYYAKTRLAFHAWPGKTFARAYNSRGCVTLRDADLNEVSAFVFGAKDALPLTVRDMPFGDVAHPFPIAEDHYWRLVDVGRPGKPAFTTMGGLYHIERVALTPPPVENLVGRYFDSEQRGVKMSQLAQRDDIPESLLP